MKTVGVAGGEPMVKHDKRHLGELCYVLLLCVCMPAAFTSCQIYCKYRLLSTVWGKLSASSS